MGNRGTLSLKSRFIFYFTGLFIMALGVAISVKSDLGVSPVSSIPYTITCIWGIEMGKATILFHTFLVFFQILLLRKSFRVRNLCQIGIGIIFGYCTTFGNWCMAFFPSPETILQRLLMILLSACMIAVGLFFYVPVHIMPMAAEGTTQAISEFTKISFSRIKIIFDISMVTVSLIVCLWVLHSPGSVGIGTVLAAFFVGTILGWLNRIFGKSENE